MCRRRLDHHQIGQAPILVSAIGQRALQNEGQTFRLKLRTGDLVDIRQILGDVDEWRGAACELRRAETEHLRLFIQRQEGVGRVGLIITDGRICLRDSELLQHGLLIIRPDFRMLLQKRLGLGRRCLRQAQRTGRVQGGVAHVIGLLRAALGLHLRIQCLIVFVVGKIGHSLFLLAIRLPLPDRSFLAPDNRCNEQGEMQSGGHRATRKQGTPSSRVTRKQRGGAKFSAAIPAIGRKALWADMLKQVGLTQPTLLTEATPDPASETAPSKADAERRITAYINTVANMDRIFEAAYIGIRKILTEDPQVRLPAYQPGEDKSAIRTLVLRYATQIEARKADAYELLDDVERACTFQVDTTVDEGLGATKLQQINSGPLTQLVLYPSTLTNIMLDTIARICVDLKQSRESTLTKYDGAGDKAAAQTVITSRWKALAHSTAWATTASELRDGFFLNQGIINFRENEDAFWGDFFNGLLDVRAKGGDDAFVTAAGAPCPRDIRELAWGTIAAHVYLAYKSGRLEDILTYFAAAKPEACLRRSTRGISAVTPDPVYNTFAVPETGGATLAQLYAQMDDATLYFILQLAASIKAVEAAAQAS
jgi:hypothetical protein